MFIPWPRCDGVPGLFRGDDRTMAWWQRPMAVLDFETTGTDVETDRAVQVALLKVGPTGVLNQLCQIIDPGVDVPEAAARIHGITTERARREGRDPAEVLGRVGQALEGVWRDGIPVVIMNSSFDLTLLDRELRRHHGRSLAEADMLVLDPMVIDRELDPRRPGKRTLTALATHYRVRQEGAHDALADCLTTARIAWRLPRMHPDWAAMGLTALQGWQADAHRRWAEDYQSYLRRRGGRPDAVIDTSWPWRPLDVTAGV
ncbi:3'-5' exonuclease [Parafrankia sp. EAN1pec]|uniref:3'-5' exonuclease n=1 Tax=Parafrankia sp. (strain EAN1pec) TaxID=298653 RepID=UPI00321BCF6E